MIQKFVEAIQSQKPTLESIFRKTHPNDYLEMVTEVVKLLPEVNGYKSDPNRIHEIDDGEYQGTLVYVIASDDYQPNVYWYVKVYYGSCSGCDTLQGIRGYSDDLPSEEQVEDYYKLALDIVTGIHLMPD